DWADTVVYPACHKVSRDDQATSVIAVTGNDWLGNLWYDNVHADPAQGGNYGAEVDISAPASYIWTTDMVGHAGNDHVSGYVLGYVPGAEGSDDQFVQNWGGTSLAAPHVTG